MAKNRKRKQHCASCESWEPGDCWFTNHFGVYAPGTCKNTGRAVDNCHHACMFYNRKSNMGVFQVFDGDKLIARSID